MKQIFILLAICLLIGCNPPNSSVKSIAKTINDSLNPGSVELKMYRDSLLKLIIDTSTLKGKRENIMRNFLIDNSPSNPDLDTLIDLNYDKHLDYVIGYYGLSGTGLKNRIKVYLFNNDSNKYSYNELLSDIPNPTFYLKQKKITGFYIGNGGGDGTKLEWIDNCWKITKTFTVEFNGEKSAIWKIEYPLKHKKDSIILLYLDIPAILTP